MGAGLSSPMGPRDAQPPAPDLTAELRMTVHVPVEEVVATAEAAGKAILGIYEGEASKWELELKSDNSPLTKADRVANSIICSALQRISPHVPIVSEENMILPYDVRKNFEYFWLVDPVDGTKEFLKRNGEFTVNIALMYRDSPVLGVVHVPCTAKTYWAFKGKGAWLREGPDARRTQRRISAAQFGFGDSGLRVVTSGMRPNAHLKDFLALLEAPEIVQVGSSLKLLMVAEGSAHVYPRMVPCCEWDTAAADVIVREAGGVVLQAGACDDDGNALEDWKAALLKEQPLLYNKPNLLNPFFVVFGQRRVSADEEAVAQPPPAGPVPETRKE